MASHRSRTLLVLFLAPFLLLAGCGYSATGKAARIPENIRTIAVPAFVNQTQKYKIEEKVTADVVQEFLSRSRFKVVNDESAQHDAVLKGVITSAVVAPLTYDSATGRATTATVTVTLRVTLTDASGHTLYDRQNYTFREEYQVSRELTSFFEEESPAFDRLARDFARQLVADVLEAW